MKKGRIKGTRHFSFGFLIVFFILLMAVFSFVSLGGKAEAAITQVGQSETFNFTGGMQTFTVSVTGYYNIELYGASGGNSNTAAGYGRGGKVAGTIYLKAGDVLYIFVGGAGKEGVGSDSRGYNGGGNATGTFAGGEIVFDRIALVHSSKDVPIADSRVLEQRSFADYSAKRD